MAPTRADFRDGSGCFRPRVNDLTPLQREIESIGKQWYFIPMSTTVQAVRDEAMTLSLSERARLAHELILSLDEPFEEEMDND